jgi:hypothetical protein
MEAQEILEHARQPGDLPEGWTVIPLDRKAVRMAVLGWAGGAVVGFGLCVLLWTAVHTAISIFHVIVFAVLGFVGVGSLVLLADKVRQLIDADRFLIVMTPDTFVEQTGNRLVALPMHEIGHITLRGVFGGDTSYATRDERDYRTAVVSPIQLLGGRQTHRRRRTPDSLAFVDLRDGSDITVAKDNAFTELPILDELLRNYVEAARKAHNVT